MTVEEAITRITDSKKFALLGQSKLTPEVLKIEGFSTDIQRHLFNNLCAGQTRYLEIGVFCGATACAALYKNVNTNAVLVENFSQDFSSTDVRIKLWKSLVEFCPVASYYMVEADAFDDAPGFIKGPFDIFFFDGEHSYESQFKALPFYLDKMADVFIYAVDDYAWKDVERGTQDAIAQLVQEKKLRVAFEWSVQPPENDHPIWHNGLYLGVMERL